jgi:hypothetical protein
MEGLSFAVAVCLFFGTVVLASRVLDVRGSRRLPEPDGYPAEI